MTGRGAILRARLAAAFLAWTLLPGAAEAEPLVADLTSHLIGISTGFTGTSIVLFGATDGGGDIVVVVRGPAREFSVRRKRRVGAIWINTRQITFGDVPGFYAVASSRPLEEITSPSTRAANQIGAENVRLTPLTRANDQRIAEFRKALIETEQKDGIFAANTGKVDFLGERLFRTTIVFPANVPTGTYSVEVLLVRDKEVIAAQTTPLVVSKIGVDAKIYEFADRQSLAYGVVAVMMAVMAGWLASLAFRSA
jgi:uncharacterized protein (TIGR02186 family)